jgi:hypothetical protein
LLIFSAFADSKIRKVPITFIDKKIAFLEKIEKYSFKKLYMLISDLLGTMFFSLENKQLLLKSNLLTVTSN